MLNPDGSINIPALQKLVAQHVAQAVQQGGGPQPGQGYLRQGFPGQGVPFQGGGFAPPGLAGQPQMRPGFPNAQRMGFRPRPMPPTPYGGGDLTYSGGGHTMPPVLY